VKDPEVFIVGTSHTFQLGKDGQKAREFRRVLIDAAKSNVCLLIAEELNPQALAEAEVPTSVPQDVATELGLEHVFCDPNRDERASLGIVQETDIQAKYMFKTTDEEVIQTEIDISLRAREEYWVERLKHHSLWPLLFVCGANHVRSLCDLLQVNGIVATVVESDWE
jgi:hypothetical protein